MSSKSILTLLLDTVVVIPVSPSKLSVSVPSVIVSVPLSPLISVVVTMFTLAVLALVIRPCASIVKTGIALPLP